MANQSLPNQFIPARDLKGCGQRVRIYPGATIIGPEWIEIGSDVIIDSHASIFASEECPVKIGHYVHIGAHSSIAGGPVVMEDFSGIAHGVRLVAGSDEYNGTRLTNPTIPKGLRTVHRAGIKIGRHSVIGANSVIMPGAIVEEGVAIGAGSVLLAVDSLTQLPWQIWAGVPARFIKERNRAIAEATVEGVRKYVKDHEGDVS